MNGGVGLQYPGNSLAAGVLAYGIVAKARSRSGADVAEHACRGDKRPAASVRNVMNAGTKGQPCMRTSMQKGA